MGCAAVVRGEAGQVGLSAGTFDLLGLVVLLLALCWGMWYGVRSQLLSLAMLLLALVGARWLAPHLEQPLTQAWSVSSASLPAAAWALAVAILLLALSLLARLLRGLGAPPAPPGRVARLLGGVLGLAKGVLLWLVLAYTAVSLAPDAQARVWGAQSRLLPALSRLRAPLGRLLDLPECTDEAAARVEGWLPPAPPGS